MKDSIPIQKNVFFLPLWIIWEAQPFLNYFKLYIFFKHSKLHIVIYLRPLRHNLSKLKKTSSYIQNIVKRYIKKENFYINIFSNRATKFLKKTNNIQFDHRNWNNNFVALKSHYSSSLIWYDTILSNEFLKNLPFMV